ncbi:hypothetical protein GCM10007036_07890 [Alsobacter metallidurans]|uniref:Uncharacterized protein n=1 Tax=Alsobacter metallidurans TaxID=340221 RepID=A0A917I4B3_9HYPH|nr:hypothetical protein GCM10007036_07890 [Alsobacter metallidurans]
MSIAVHPTAPHALPPFITEPGQSDVLMVVTGIFLLFAVLGVGLLFLRLHTLPERMAHKSQKLQFEIVAVLGLIALFTHEHIFWVAGLLLALVDLPDWGAPLRRMAGALEKMAGILPGEGADAADIVEREGSGAFHDPADRHDASQGVSAGQDLASVQDPAPVQVLPAGQEVAAREGRDQVRSFKHAEG